MDDAVKQVQMRKVRQLYAMLDGTGCRAAAVRRYFGETGVDALRPVRPAASTRRRPSTPPQAAQKALSAVHRLGGRFGRGRIVDHLLGKTKDVIGLEAAHVDLRHRPEFSAAGWRDLLDQLLFEGLLREDPNDGRPLIGLGDADDVRAVYRGERRVSVRQMPAGAEAAGRAGRPRGKRHGGERLGIEAADAAPVRGAARLAPRSAPPSSTCRPTSSSTTSRSRPSPASVRRAWTRWPRSAASAQSKLKRYGDDVLRVVREN